MWCRRMQQGEHWKRIAREFGKPRSGALGPVQLQKALHPTIANGRPELHRQHHIKSATLRYYLHYMMLSRLF